MSLMFVVYVYNPRLNNCSMEMIKAFKNRDEAINFAKRYSFGESYENRTGENFEIVGIEYNGILLFPDLENEDLEEYYDVNPLLSDKSVTNLLSELNLDFDKYDFKYIAVSAVKI